VPKTVNENTKALDAGISHVDPERLLANQINVLGGISNKNGAAFAFLGTKGGFFLNFVNIRSCKEQTIFYSQRQNQKLMLLSSTNIIANRDSIGILYDVNSGFPLSACVFSGNMDGKDLVVSATVQAQFSLTDCSISGIVPSQANWQRAFSSVSDVTIIEVNTTDCTYGLAFRPKADGILEPSPNLKPKLIRFHSLQWHPLPKRDVSSNRSSSS
jgi:hypothetical protein